MAAPKYTEAQYEALNKAIAEGAREVWYGDKRVAFRSLDEMYRIQSDMEKYLGLNTTPTRVYADFQKGTD